MPVYTHTTAVAASAEELFAWHERPSAFARLNPPFDPVEIVSVTGRGLEEGVTLSLAASVGPVHTRWVSRHTACHRPSGFVDEQIEGPFARWRHEHRFADGSLTDHIDWEVPFGAFGRIAQGAVGRRIERAFRFRHERTAWDLARLAPHRGEGPLRVGLTGANGLVGRAVAQFLDAGGHEVVPFSRGAKGSERSIRWDPAAGSIDASALEGLDVIIHLAGEPIGAVRWTEEQKNKILKSRVDGTALLAKAIASCTCRPRALVMASAVGFYGDRGDELLSEDSPRGTGFLADVVEAWEASAAPARDAGVRVAMMRFGLVLASNGGLLQRLLPVFRVGMGGPVGSGAQWQPWVALDDVVGALFHALWDSTIQGPINVVAPEAERQSDFASCLGRVLGRPAFVPAPAAALRATLGREMTDELLLASQRTIPTRLIASGFRFGHPFLEDMLRQELGVAPRPGSGSDPVP